MRCDDYGILISAAADGELDPASLADLTAHLESCESCRREYEATASLQQGLTGVLAQCGDVPSLTDRVMARVATRRRPAFRWMWSAAAACAVVLALVTVLLWPVRHETEKHEPARLVRNVTKPMPRTTNPVVATDTKQASEPERASVSRPHESKPKPRPGPSTIATEPKRAPEPVRQAEVTVEYSDEDASPGPAATDLQAGLPLPSRMWQGGKMVASCTTVIENGKPVERPSFRLIPDSTHGEGEL